MKRKYTMMGGGSWIALSALACGLATGVPGCGGAPDSTSTNPQDEGSNENGAINNSGLAAAKQKYPAAWAAAQSLIATRSELEGRFIADVKELYRPDVEGAAYLDFALLKKGENAGHVIASTAGHDFPIIAWNDKGTTRVRSMEQMHAVDLSNTRVYMLDFETFVAERPDGSLLTGGAPMTPEGLASGKEFMLRMPAEKKTAFAQTVAAEWNRLAKEDHSIPLPPDVQSDVSALCPDTGCGGDPCRAGQPNWPKCMGCQGSSMLVRGADIIDLAPYNQFNSSYYNGSCLVGCTPVAFGIIQAWAARQAGDHRDGGAWGHPRMAYAFNALGDAWAAQPRNDDASDMNTDAKSVIINMRTSLGTSCTSDGQGGTSTFPPDNIRSGAQRHFNANAIPIQTWSSNNSSQSTYINEIGSNIQHGIPVEINGSSNPYGSGGHSWVVYGQATSSCSGTYYKLALGWGKSHMGEWVAQGTVLNAIPGFANLAGTGVVTFGPSGLSRDYGPITTGAGSGWCLDVPGFDTNNGANVQQFGCNGGNNQLWYLDRPNLTQPGWQIRNRHSGKCLAPWDGGSYDGAQVVQWDCNPDDSNTLWNIERHGNVVAIKHYPSWRYLDLDSSGGLEGNGKKIQMWSYLNGSNQFFDFAP